MNDTNAINWQPEETKLDCQYLVASAWGLKFEIYGRNGLYQWFIDNDKGRTLRKGNLPESIENAKEHAEAAARTITVIELFEN